MRFARQLHHHHYHCRGFTLIEVMVASFVLALLATGAIAATWRLAGFARLKASELAAESFCSDVAMAYYAQGEKLQSMVSTTPCVNHRRLTREHPWLPHLKGKDSQGKSIDVIPFWREGFKDPEYSVLVTNSVLGAKVITVSLYWGTDGDDGAHTSTFVMSETGN